MTKVVICTSPRPEKYVYRTVNNIKEQIPIHLFANGNDISYLNELSLDPRINITQVPFLGTNILPNQVENYKRCLSEGYVEGEKGILIFEDDVKFATGWRKRFESVVLDLESKCGEKFALSLFTALPLCLPSNLPPEHYVSVPSYRFYGLQGMYYPNFVRKELVEYLEKTKKAETINHDIIIKEYFIESNIPIFVTIPCLVNHIGYTSSWKKSCVIRVATIFHSVVD